MSNDTVSPHPAPPPPPAVNRQRMRWLVPPVVAFALIAGFGVGPNLVGSGAAAAPVLPDISAQDLVAKIVAADPPAFSGTVQTKTNLGLPSLGSLAPGGSSLLTTLLSPQTINVAAAPGGKFHLAIPNGLSETDVVSDGTQVWVWQSSLQTVTHLAKPADSGSGDKADAGTGVEPTPDAVAKELLANAGPTTRVFVRGTASVAGHDAYELVLSPKSADTLVADVVIDVDAATSLPLRVQVVSKNAGTPALDVAFTNLTMAAPAASSFTFTPPPGAKVIEAASPRELLLGRDRPQAAPDGSAARHQKVAPPNGAAPGPAQPSAPTTSGPETQVLGTGWDSVLALPNGPNTLSAAGTPVSGTWGSGKLVTSTLADILVLDNGTVLVGMVGPDRLEAAVAELHP